MYPTQLKPLLAEDAFGPNQVVPIAEICERWFRDEGSLESFVLWGVFTQLRASGWDDEQGIPTPDYEQFCCEAEADVKVKERA